MFQMESMVVIFGFGFFGGCIVSGWVTFFAWKRFTTGFVRRLAIEAASRTTGGLGEPNTTQRLDMRQIGALLAQALPAAPEKRSIGTEAVAPKRVITPSRKVSAIRPVAEARNTIKSPQKERGEEGTLRLGPA